MNWKRDAGKRVIGNKSASGTEIIEELGEEEINTGAHDRLYIGRFCYADLWK